MNSIETGMNIMEFVQEDGSRVDSVEFMAGKYIQSWRTRIRQDYKLNTVTVTVYSEHKLNSEGNLYVSWYCNCIMNVFSRFRVGVDGRGYFYAQLDESIKHEPLTVKQIRNMVGSCITIMDCYLPVVEKISELKHITYIEGDPKMKYTDYSITRKINDMMARLEDHMEEVKENWDVDKDGEMPQDEECENWAYYDEDGFYDE
ncbi:MAG: hypothetical protein IJN77_07455 [Oscillospiraceae bacterium]|nr:hypothetical protein [Oscillospiraceae bacterium]